jgi:tetratricopeptide (TPR) repeat protein
MRFAPTTAAFLVLAAAPLAAQSTVAEHVAAGDAARCEADAEEALAHFRAALELDSMNYEVNWKLARLLVDMGKPLPDQHRARRDTLYAEALRRAERAVAVNPRGADGHFMVSLAQGRIALTRGARERVRYARVVRDAALRASELNPRHDGALHVLGRWNAEIQRLPGVTKFFARTFLGAAIFSEATWDNAVGYLERAIAIDSGNIYHHLDLAEALVDMGRAEDAVPLLERVAVLQPGCDPEDPVYKQQAEALLRRITRR